jgi:4-aminobutyrate aminotransferase
VMGDVRGLGLMDGVEFTRDGQPDPVTAKAVMAAALDEGLILLSCGTFDNVIRWIPPLVVTAQEIDKGVDLFANALHKCVTDQQVVNDRLINAA